eukprot:CAMPEP_0202956896 /NCGR_PEP_ID=MMETSP1396-20130829/1366_1 /ASSEMBLY_ACC=CAM_ASM_000872 /TAXON_ID= /ORGANISM="Pseudokeronopsis sp., Strain Brazil" /LENGTH=209 /DNA_ID=CAMNT_0049674115 /DNA_START=43 /DNA_END=669 /DNA_ORIENTATION=+
MALLFANECQAQLDIPQIPDLERDTAVNMAYKFISMFIKFKGIDFQETYGDALDCAPTVTGALELTKTEFSTSGGLATADDKKESWWEYDFTSVYDIEYIDSLITEDPYFLDTVGNAWLVLGGADPIELGDGSECLAAIHSNVLFQIAGVDCNGVLVEFALDAFLDGWTEVDAANAPSTDFTSVSVDTNGYIWGVTSAGVIWTYTGTDW